MEKFFEKIGFIFAEVSENRHVCSRVLIAGGAGHEGSDIEAATRGVGVRDGEKLSVVGRKHFDLGGRRITGWSDSRGGCMEKGGGGTIWFDYHSRAFGSFTTGGISELHSLRVKQRDAREASEFTRFRSGVPKHQNVVPLSSPAL